LLIRDVVCTFVIEGVLGHDHAPAVHRTCCRRASRRSLSVARQGGLRVICIRSEVPARRGEGAKEPRYGAEELGAAAQGFRPRGGVGLQLGIVSAASLTRARPNSRPLLAPRRAISPQRAISPAPPGLSRADLTTGPSPGSSPGPSLGP